MVDTAGRPAAQGIRRRLSSGGRPSSRTRMILSAIVLVAVLAAVTVGPLVVPHSPTEVDLRSASLKPFTSMTHPLGTDQLGRDVLARTMAGGRSEVLVAIMAVLTAMIVGTTLGVLGAWYRGAVDTLILRIAEVQLSIPAVLLALTVLGTGLGGYLGVTVVLILACWPTFHRLSRAGARRITASAFVDSGRLLGASTPRIMLRYLIPSLSAGMAAIGAVEIGASLTLVSALSYIGVGLTPPDPAWGSMIAEGQTVLTTMWWVAAAPALCLTVFILALNALGDAISHHFAIGREAHG